MHLGRFLLLVLSLALPAPTANAQTRDEGRMLAKALEVARTGDWAEAAKRAGATGSDAAADVILWTQLRDGVGDFADYQSFLAGNPDWPGLSRLRRQGERHMPETLSPAEVRAFFAESPPRSGTGALRLAEALVQDGARIEAEAEIVRAWTELSLTSRQQKAFLQHWGDIVAPHHVARLDMLLWRGWTGEASDMLPLVDPDWQALARARIAVRDDIDGMMLLIGRVPKALRTHPGLAYERYLYRVGKGRWEDAERYLLEQSGTADTLGEPDFWMERRANLARQALRRGEVDVAYRLAAQNFGTSGADFADAEWLAGYIALIHMKEPERAVEHFRRFAEAVASPISLGRAGFWLGLAHERAGDADAAHEAYTAGARHQTSFYGQLAAARAELSVDPALAGTEATPDWREAEFLASSVVEAARYLIAAEEDALALQFLQHYAEGKPAGTRAALAQMAIDLDRTHIAIRIAKDAAAAGVIIPAQYYPLAEIAEHDWPVPTEFALAIARQESEMNPEAVSTAGARGLMQLLPGTAEPVARALGVPFSIDRLGSDPLFNARLGTAYLARMLDRFGGSYVLAAAAYNAGPGRVAQWIDDYGDPRRPDIDPITWIETIPYSETRNYVMRVLEGVNVYRARLGTPAEPIRLVEDINRTG